MTILVPGHKGFVGRYLAPALNRLGHTVIPMGRGDPFPDSPVEAIINCAGEINDLTRMVDSNTSFVGRLLDWALAARAKVIHIGSSSEYGSTNRQRKESDACTPASLYDGTKLAATALCQGYAAQYDMDICVARPFSLYGAADAPRKLIPRLLTAYRTSETLDVYAGSHDWVYIDDFIDGLITLLNSPREKTKGDIVNFGTGVATTNREVIATLACSGITVRARYHDEKRSAYDVANWQAYPFNTTLNYGWEAKWSFEAGIRETVNRERQSLHDQE